MGKRMRCWEEGALSQLWGLHPRLGHDPVLLPDADCNMMSHPSILLNVSLNTLLLALHVKCQALKKPHPKVRGPGVPTEHSWYPSLC